MPIPRKGVRGTLGNWMSLAELDEAVAERFPGCMRGRTMYVVPFSMGPVGSPLSKIGIELTDSPYVVASMRIMTRMGAAVLQQLGDGDFVKCLHSVGRPQTLAEPSRRALAVQTRDRRSSLTCPSGARSSRSAAATAATRCSARSVFALRIGSTIARREGWLAEHMLILGITNPAGQKRYIAAAFPSACGKTNLAMMAPSLPGYKVECVGDDIAWMRFDKNGVLRAINPENGFFGVAPGTSSATNPMAMATVAANTVFTNVARTADGGVFWEGLEKEVDASSGVDRLAGQAVDARQRHALVSPQTVGFCAPAGQCPIIDPQWESPEGVPISAILFGGRRPEGVPLVYEAFSWEHGVLLGAAMR